MNGAQLLLQILQQHNLDTAFGYPGGCIMPLYDALVEGGVRHVLCRHEQAAALAAGGYARASGRLGVCIATSGPGATNLITGVADAQRDSIPLLVITGQVPSDLIGTDAFQETDVLGLSLGTTKHSYLVTDAADIAAITQEAITLAITGRPGPVWIDISKDALLAEAHTASAAPSRPDQFTPDNNPSELALEHARQWLQRSQRPILYIGGGVARADAVSLLRKLAEHWQIPQVTTLNGIGCCDPDHPLWLGMLGMHGTPAANEAVQAADLLICIGARFDDRATGRLDEFAPHAKVIQLDIDPVEIGKLRYADIAIHGPLEMTLSAWLNTPKPAIDAWRQQCGHLKQTRGLAVPCHTNNTISGPMAVETISRLADDITIACDVGQHQMWVAQYAKFHHPRNHLSSGGLGTMGFGLPAAIGAAFSRPGDPVINITGDGSFLMNVQELATLAREKLPVKILILDNQCLGMVRQQQELFYQGRYSGIDLSDNPDFCALGKAFGIASTHCGDAEKLEGAIDAWLNTPGPALLHLSIAPEENVWPTVAPGSGNHQMLERA